MHPDAFELDANIANFVFYGIVSDFFSINLSNSKLT